MEDKITKTRYHLIDALRGFAVVCMVFFHAFVTMSDIYNLPLGAKLVNFFSPAEPYFAGLFIFISGIACSLSSSNLKRGIKLLIIALLITLATFVLSFFGLQVQIWFGILHLLSFSILITAALTPLTKKINPALAAAACFALFLFTRTIESRYLSLLFLKIPLPGILYSVPYLFPFGFYTENFSSADYFPLLPWLFLFLCGAFIGRYEQKGKFPGFLKKSLCPPLEYIGRRALIIYILHQPIIAAVLFVILKLFRIR
ncbi:MAG TPA: DUF1624 domain-containing protein [Clostridiales bacterium]|nr:DUF1624 domain-containing protein [Clostridiales bacterium]